jgi:hypothetical protein
MNEETKRHFAEVSERLEKDDKEMNLRRNVEGICKDDVR